MFSLGFKCYLELILCYMLSCVCNLRYWRTDRFILLAGGVYLMDSRLSIQATKILGTRNLPWLVCNFSSNSSSGLYQRQLVGSASSLQLSCINRTVLLFSFLCRHHLAECLSRTDNFSLSHTILEKFYFIFTTTALYSSYQRERPRT